MSDIRLGTDGDLYLNADNDLELIEGVDAIAQDISTRLQTFLGEWYLDERIGMPYFQQILGQKPRLGLVRSLYNDAIISTPGVNTINDLTLDYNTTTRALSISFRADTVSGALVYEKEFVLP